MVIKNNWIIISVLLLFGCTKDTAKENQIVYQVTFDSKGGSNVPKQNIYKGDKVVEPKEPKKTNYIFDSWYKDDNDFKNKFDFSSEVISSDITLYAKWFAVTPGDKKVKIEFKSNGGSSVSSQFIDKGNKGVEPKEPSKVNFVFNGWYKEAALTNIFDFSSVVNTNIILYAKWTAVAPGDKKVKIEFESNGGSSVSSQFIDKGDKVVEPKDPTRAGFSFAGWYKQSALTNVFVFSTEVLNSDMILYAKWLDPNVFDLTDAKLDLNHVKYKEEYVPAGDPAKNDDSRDPDRALAKTTIAMPYLKFSDNKPLKAGENYEAWTAFNSRLDIDEQRNKNLTEFRIHKATRDTDTIWLFQFKNIMKFKIPLRMNKLYYMAVKKNKNGKIIAKSKVDFVNVMSGGFRKKGSWTYASVGIPNFGIHSDNGKPVFIFAEATSSIKFLCPNIAQIGTATEEDVDKTNKFYSFWKTNSLRSYENIAVDLNYNDTSGFKSPTESQVQAECLQPTKLEFHAITFRRFRTLPDEPIYMKGKVYYFIVSGNGKYSSMTSDVYCKDEITRAQCDMMMKCEEVKTFKPDGTTPDTYVVNSQECKDLRKLKAEKYYDWEEEYGACPSAVPDCSAVETKCVATGTRAELDTCEVRAIGTGRLNGSWGISSGDAISNEPMRFKVWIIPYADSDAPYWVPDIKN